MGAIWVAMCVIRRDFYIKNLLIYLIYCILKYVT